MLKPRYLIGFTGHRSEFSEPDVRSGLTATLTDLQQKAIEAGGQAELYASAAEGADTLCVEIARDLGMPVHILLPLPECEFEKDFSSPEAWARSKAQIDQAAVMPGSDSLHTVEGEATRPECYFNQAVTMLEAVDVLIAVWNGEPAKGLGGTGQVVAQARATQIPVVRIHPSNGKTETDPKVAEAFARDSVIAELNGIAASEGGACREEASTPDELFTCLDKIAQKEADKFRPSLVRVILVHGIAALLAALVTFKLSDKHAPWEEFKWVVTGTELALVSFALWMSFQIHKRHIQEKWIRCRFACELVRGLRASVPLIDPLHPSISRHDPKWRRFALSAGLLVLAHNTRTDPTEQRNHYLETRLSRSHTDGQIKHYLEMSPRALAWWNFTGALSVWSAKLAPAFVLLSLLNKLSKHWHQPHGWKLEYAFFPWIGVVFLPIALPLIAGVASSLRHALDAGRRKDRYPQMVNRLEETKAALSGLETPSTIRRSVSRSEEILLDELLEWQLAMKNTGH